MNTTMTRAEHLAWCKQRALDDMAVGDVQDAFASMASDLQKHPETQGHAGIGLGIIMLASGQLSTADEMERFIKGFN